ncbi:D-alanyl-D-alanine carboxypeptidase/D-alanyl-D-alanine endopeptidase [Arundinibacter roseus]|uniref:D-alanyl-D-alanine carboxypeptidase/D-alanyl-D-alanine endopeptidase n=1 Tax=Arundinibacter roseus TaxID=2070510 RepID=UPI001E577C88|nr:D-alanyl-D-alanine carboxypeptidase/D-alanyl-D-alanine-endopeptidase [Arundinibacter roseus]
MTIGTCCKRILLIAWLLGGITQPLHSQVVDSLGLANLTDALLELQNSELMQNGTLSFSLTSCQTDRPLLILNQKQSLPSASILKLVSTATVLSVFGGDYTYKTFLEYDGQKSGDTLKGNLYIRGTGDPSLGSDRFKDFASYQQLLSRWSTALAQTGIKHVQGQVIADASFFDEQSLADTWIWADLGNYYGAGVQGLNFNENKYTMLFRTGSDVGQPSEVLRTEPALPFLHWTNRVTSGPTGSGDRVYMYASPLSKEVLLTGTVPRNSAAFSVRGAIPNPSFAVAYLLTQELTQKGITISGEPSTIQNNPQNSPRTVLDTHTSPTLRELCQQTNWWSINLYADSFLKLIGRKLTDEPDFSSSVQAVIDYWQQRGVSMNGFFIKDGSGLSPTGSLTTQNLTGILNAATRDKTFPDFYSSIAILGETGTVRNMGKGTRAAGNVRAKSGSIEGTRAYAGYVVTKEGERLSFAIIAHKYTPNNSRAIGIELARLLILLGDL